MINKDDNFSRLFDEDYYRQLENEIKNHGKGNPPTPPVNSKEKRETQKRPTPNTTVYKNLRVPDPLCHNAISSAWLNYFFAKQ